MGCDINLYFEQKNTEGKWEKIDVPERLIPDDRYYELFAFLAGVRNYDDFYITGQFLHRGIPIDASCPKEQTDDFYLGDHSFTYAYLDEILKSPWEKVKLHECYFYAFCKHVLPRLSTPFYRESHTDEEERNIRVIMGFNR